MRGADLVTTDVWTSMGFEAENEVRKRAFGNWQVTARHDAPAQPDALFMHCLPAHRGEEVAADVIDGPQSVVWDEAENRLHAQKALLEYLVCGRVTALIAIQFAERQMYRLLVMAIVSIAVVGVSTAGAQAWPDRPIKFLMSAPAGSSIDVLARAIADKLKDRLGQPVIVENKPAAGGTVATAEVANSAPDGYTMVLAFNGPLSFAPLLQKLPYDVAKDLAPVIITSSQPNVLAVNATLPVRSIAELVAYAKANPGKLNYASVGNGSSSHLNMELFKSVAGFDAVHVPFNGSPPAVKSTVQNETQMIFAVMQPLQAQIQAGTAARAGGDDGQALFAAAGSAVDRGIRLPGFEALAWNGVLVAAGTPRPIVARLNTEMNAILKEPEMRQKMQGFGFDLVGGTPEEFGALISGETAQWAPVIKKVGLKVD